MEDLLSYGIRTVLIFIFAYFGARVLSKKAVAEMTAYEMAGIILLSTVAAEPLVTKVVTKAVFGTGLIVVLITVISRLALVNKLTPILEHTPTIVVKNGKPDMKALKETMLSQNELYGLLRQKGYAAIGDVEFAILEPQGKISVIPKSQNRPVQPKDLNIPTQYEGLTLPLIMDGEIIEKNLQHANLSKSWLQDQLKNQGYDNYRTQVALAELTTSGNLSVSRKQQ